MKMNPLTRERWARFRAHKRGYWSMWIFASLFVISLFAEIIANDKPLVINFNSNWYFPIAEQYTETEFGGEFESEADYTDPYVADLIEADGYMIWPIIRFSYDTINYDLAGPAPSPPDSVNWLGTDDKGRDVLARIIYGFRISVLFGFALTIISTMLSFGLVGSHLVELLAGDLQRLPQQRLRFVRIASTVVQFGQIAEHTGIDVMVLAESILEEF